MLKSRNVRIMLFLFAVMFMFTFVLGCDDTGDSAFVDGAVEDIVGWGNDLADSIDEGADELGIPNNVSGAIYDELFPSK